VRLYRYRLFDVEGLTTEEVEFTVQVKSGETVRAESGRLLVVFAVVEVEDEPRYAGVLMAEPVGR
jgi:hypothetical protein